MSSPLERPASPVNVHRAPSSENLQVPLQENARPSPIDQTELSSNTVASPSWCGFVLNMLQNAMIFFIDNSFNLLHKPCELLLVASDYITGLARDVGIVASRCLFAPEFDPHSPKFNEQLTELTAQATAFEKRFQNIEAMTPISIVNLMQTLNQLIQFHSELKASAERIRRFSNATRRCNDLAELHANTVRPLLERFQMMQTNCSDFIRNDVQWPAVDRFDNLIGRLWEFGAKIPRSFTNEFKDMLWMLDRAFDTGLFNDLQWENHRKDFILQRINALETGPDVTASADQNAPPRLRNLGNSCYMNALTQMIFTIPDLAQRLENPLARLPRESDQAYERRENIRKELFYFTQPRVNQQTTVPTLTNLQILFLVSENNNDKSAMTVFGDSHVSGQSRLPSVTALQKSIFEPKWRYDLRMQLQRMETELRNINTAISRMDDRRFDHPELVSAEEYARLQGQREREQARLQSDPEYIRIQGLINNGVDYGDFIYENLLNRRQLDSAQILELYMDATLPFRFQQEIVLKTDMFPGLEFVKKPELNTAQQLPIQTPEELRTWAARNYPGAPRITQQIRDEHQVYQRQMSSLGYQIHSFFQENVNEGQGRDFDPSWIMDEDNIEVRDVGPEAAASRQRDAFSRAANLDRLEAEPELFRYTERCFLRNLPDVLPLHLKRFENITQIIPSGEVRQVLRKVDFGITLPEDGFVDLTEYQDAAERDQPAVYRITSYVEHIGGLNGGHYVAYVEKNGRYYYCSDTTVNEVNRERFINNRNAYTIMLKRVSAEEAAEIQARRLAATID